MEWSTACPDWEERIVNRQPLITLPPLFPAQGQAGLDIFTSLKVKDVPGCPTMGEVCRPWTLDFVRSIFGAYDEDSGRRLINEFLLLISKKNSKALALDTPIPTPAGWTTMGCLEAGDWVLGADGKPCRVTATSPVFTDHECFRLEFSNGESVVADAGHLWETSTIGKEPAVRTTAEIASTLYRQHDGARNHSLRMPAPLDLPSEDLPFPPYTLGAWLGDGDSKAARITCADEGVMAQIQADGFLLGTRTATASKAWSQTFGVLDRTANCERDHGASERSKTGRCLACERETDHALRHGRPAQPKTVFTAHARLRSLGLLGDKHIPDVYFRASRGQRLALLQGLMDTDGTIGKAGTSLSFTNTNRRLIDGVCELLASLGVKYSVTKRPMTCSGRPIPGDCWTVQFMAFRDELPVFRLERKLARMRAAGPGRRPRSKSVQVVSATPVPSVPVKCITVDAPDHLFLFGRTMLPTHNSTTAAGIMLTALLWNWREAAEFLILAPTVEIANNSYYPARDMVREDDELRDLLQVQDHIRTITHRVTGATLKVIAAENETVGGKKATGVLIDELWLFGKRADAENMVIEATGGLASRPEGFVIYLSTMSDAPPAGIFAKKLGYARKVRDGEIHDPQFLPLLYEYPKWMLEAKAERDIANAYVTNPNLGASVDEAFLARKLQIAKGEGESSLRAVLAKHFNVQIGVALLENRWAGADFWEAAAEPGLTFESILARSDLIVVGIDGGGLDDLLGVAVLGRCSTTGKWLHWGMAVAHEIVLTRRPEIATRLVEFKEAGHLEMVAVPGEDVERVVAVVDRVRATGKLHKVALDPAGISATVEALEAIGVTREADQIIGVSQGWRLNGAIKTTERKVASRELVHCGQPLIAWAVGNARTEQKGNATVVTKQVSGSAKIDPVCALFDAVTILGEAPASQNLPSGYSLMMA